MAATQRIKTPEGRDTWTVLGNDWHVIGPAEEYLEFLRNVDRSPNTVKSYARALALYWTFLEHTQLRWDHATVETFGSFLGQLRRGSIGRELVELHPKSPPAESTVAVRMKAVFSCYRYHATVNGVPAAMQLYDRLLAHPGNYRPFLEHVAARSGRVRTRVPLRVTRKRTPVFTPVQVTRICDAAARWDNDKRRWVGTLRNRLLWSFLAETGARLGEALSLQHRDWFGGHGETPYCELVERMHPRNQQLKGGDRRIYISSSLDKLYNDYLWELCESGADTVVDLDSNYVFCNLREPLYAPLSPDSVYDHVRSIKRREPELPRDWTPHWFRHTHATALLFSGIEPVNVARRLGHSDVQTTLNTYAHVSADAQLAALANWQEWVSTWGPVSR